MDSYQKPIAALFGVTKPNNKIVDWDGYDELEKESAIKFYKGKTWQEVLSHLESLESADYMLEEWSVLNKTALEYFIRAHLEYLLITLDEAVPDEEFIYFLFGQLYQVIFMHKGSPFTIKQTELIKKIVNSTIVYVNQNKKFELQGYDQQVKLFFDELNKYGF